MVMVPGAEPPSERASLFRSEAGIGWQNVTQLSPDSCLSPEPSNIEKAVWKRPKVCDNRGFPNTHWNSQLWVSMLIITEVQSFEDKLLDLFEKYIIKLNRRQKIYNIIQPYQTLSIIIQTYSDLILYNVVLISGVTVHKHPSTITPSPKKKLGGDLRDFSPVALTSVLCKGTERSVCDWLI